MINPKKKCGFGISKNIQQMLRICDCVKYQMIFIYVYTHIHTYCLLFDTWKRKTIDTTIRFWTSKQFVLMYGLSVYRRPCTLESFENAGRIAHVNWWYVLWNPKYSIITKFMQNETYSPHLSWLLDVFSFSVFWKNATSSKSHISCNWGIFMPFITFILPFSNFLCFGKM